MKSASETAASGPASTQVPCPLYKPLWELTEDDIAQVTREDCRRFLKEKGMRRPSWNKSQAIQQVISLKALLEPKPEAEEDEEERQQHQHQPQEDDEDEEDEEGEEEEEEEEEGGRDERRASSSSSSLPKPPGESPSSPVNTAGSLPPPALSPPASSRDVTNGTQFAPTCHTNYPEAPFWRRDTVAAAPEAAAAAAPRPPLFIPGDASTTSFRIPMAAGREALPVVLPEAAGVSPRVTAVPPDLVTADATQMTIFYGGRVNVYDAVPTDKAVSIMRVAASRDCPWEFPSPHQQRPQIQQNQLLLHYNNSQQPFRLLRPPGTYGADNPASAPGASFPHPHPHPVQQSASFAAAASMGNADVNATVKTHSQSHNRILDNPDWINTKDMDDQPSDCPTSRTASLRRYLEKRKDRKIFKCKKSVEGFSPSSMETYMSQKFRSLVPNGLYNSDFYSSTHPKPPSTPTRCSSMEKQGLNRQFSIDLNDDDVQEI